MIERGREIGGEKGGGRERGSGGERVRDKGYREKRDGEEERGEERERRGEVERDRQTERASEREMGDGRKRDINVWSSVYEIFCMECSRLCPPIANILSYRLGMENKKELAETFKVVFPNSFLVVKHHSKTLSKILSMNFTLDLFGKSVSLMP